MDLSGTSGRERRRRRNPWKMKRRRRRRRRRRWLEPSWKPSTPLLLRPSSTSPAAPLRSHLSSLLLIIIACGSSCRRCVSSSARICDAHELSNQALGWLMSVPGASNTVLEAVVPYSRMSMIQLLGKVLVPFLFANSNRARESWFLVAVPCCWRFRSGLWGSFVWFAIFTGIEDACVVFNGFADSCSIL